MTICHVIKPSHLTPVKPCLHTHSNNFTPCPGLQVPPFSHGLGWHGFPTAKIKQLRLLVTRYLSEIKTIATI